MTTGPEPLQLPRFLAGPILRRAEATQVCVWAATSVPARCSVHVCALGPDGPTPLGQGQGRQVQLGPALFVHLAVATPDADAFPRGQLLGYDLLVELDGDEPRDLAALGRLDGTDSLAYPGLPLPSFVLPEPGAPLHLLHGSCRELHGGGEDAFLAADDLVAARAQDPAARPAALVLTGDQIYGDEVAGALIGHLRQLATTLLGPSDETSVPGVGNLSQVPPYGRQALADHACFTSTKAENHLLSLGEYVAAYLIAWDEATWPATFPAFDDVGPEPPGTTARDRHQRRKLHKQYDTEVERLEAARRAIPAARRVLANVPTYTCFDDHDVTDDWNLTRLWRDRVHASPTGRRVIANAMAAFWAFQGWGNDPERFGGELADVIAQGADDAGRGSTYERTLWDFDRWAYTVPVTPPMIVLDTRTQRAFDSAEGAARLIGHAELDRVRQLAMDAGVQEARHAIFVSAVPVFGLEIQERRQKFLAGKLGPYEIDFEAWHSALGGLVDLMDMIIDGLDLRRCVILSGDVHYGLTVDATFEIDGRSVHVAQLVSSAFKHSGTLARAGLDVVGRLVRPEHDRLGWQDPPEIGRAPGLVHRVLDRPANTDEWTDGGPVFLPPRLAERVDPDVRPPYREHRRYVRPEEKPASVVIGESNIGLVTVHGDDVVHVVTGRVGAEDVPHTTRIDLAARG